MNLKSFRLWSRQGDGSAAIEFSLVALPMITLILGIIELCLYFGASILLEGSTQDAARLVRTGQVQQAGASAEDIFRDRLCESASILIPCAALRYEVFALPDGFDSAADYAPDFDADGDLNPRPFDSGGVSDTVLVRVAHQYHMLTPFISQLLAGSASGRRLLMSTVVLRSEPYDFEDE